MEKSQLRKQMAHTLQLIPLFKRKNIEDQLLNHLCAQNFWKNATIIGITISQDSEWNTRPIIEAAWQQGKKVCVPKCYPDKKKLSFYQIESYEQLEVVFYNLQEPIPNETTYIDKKHIELLIVPGLVFDQNGFRIGFGGGYYDRFLKDFTNPTVSLISKRQLVDRVPREHFDIPVQHIITEDGKLI